MNKFFSFIIRQLIKSISILEAILVTFHLSPATVKRSDRMEETAALLGIHTLDACGCKLDGSKKVKVFQMSLCTGHWALD